MSYCQWRSDNWKCDVYIYDGSEGITCHVARKYHAGYIPKLPDINKVSTKKFTEAYQRQMKAVKNCVMLEHKSDRAGTTFYCDTPEEMIIELRILQDEGFRVPEYVFELLENYSD